MLSLTFEIIHMTDLLIFDGPRKHYLGTGKEQQLNSTESEIFSESAVVND